jgi:hypothetical protein
MNVQCICYCTVPATLFKFYAFIRNLFLLSDPWLADFWCNNVSLGAKGTRGGGKQRGPLLLFYTLCKEAMINVHMWREGEGRGGGGGEGGKDPVP